MYSFKNFVSDYCKAINNVESNYVSFVSTSIKESLYDSLDVLTCNSSYLTFFFTHPIISQYGTICHFVVRELSTSFDSIKDAASARRFLNIHYNKLLNQAFIQATFLEYLRHVASEPIIVTSGFRERRHNARVGGVENSHHINGCAVDIKVPCNLSSVDILDCYKSYCDYFKDLSLLPSDNEIIFSNRYIHFAFPFVSSILHD